MQRDDGDRSDPSLIRRAARCWRAARDSGAPVQQRLHAALAPIGCSMLAPVFDSLMTLCEAALGRRLATGVADAASADERLLCGLLDGSRARSRCIACDRGTASALDCAICSTRIMLAMVRA